MTECVFCKIVAGEIPSYKIYEDEEYLAFLDISQIVDGHTVVIPKGHYRWVWDVPESDNYFSRVRRIAKKMQETTGEEMVASAIWGESVLHAHIHLLPTGTDGNLELVLQAWGGAMEKRKLGEGEMEEVAERFRVD